MHWTAEHQFPSELMSPRPTSAKSAHTSPHVTELIDSELGRAVQDGVRRLAQLGLRLPERPPGEIPDLPPRISELSDVALMDLYQETLAWYEYAVGRLAIHEIQDRAAETAVEKARSAARVRNRARTATETKARAEEDPLVVQAKERSMEAYALHKLTMVVATGLENRLKYYSRELSRRLSSFEYERRSYVR